MTDKATLLALADKLEKATAPSRELDALIVCACDIRPDWLHGEPRKLVAHENGHVSAGKHGPGFYASLYTASIDAALTLIPDGMSPSVGQNVHHKHWNAFVLAIKDDEPVTVASATAPFAAIAMCAAALRARAA